MKAANARLMENFSTEHIVDEKKTQKKKQRTQHFFLHESNSSTHIKNAKR